eukprot:scaffold630977_cov33-Prasinocladus_malaysianus.AAC.1
MSSKIDIGSFLWPRRRSMSVERAVTALLDDAMHILAGLRSDVLQDCLHATQKPSRNRRARPGLVLVPVHICG